jgi:hypothetical protein
MYLVEKFFTLSFERAEFYQPIQRAETKQAGEQKYSAQHAQNDTQAAAGYTREDQGVKSERNHQANNTIPISHIWF